MPYHICSTCEQHIPEEKVKYWEALRNAILTYHEKRIKTVPFFWADIEVTVRIGGTIVEVIPPEAFELIGQDEDDIYPIDLAAPIPKPNSQDLQVANLPKDGAQESG